MDMDKIKDNIADHLEQVLQPSDEELIGKFFAESTFDVPD